MRLIASYRNMKKFWGYIINQCDRVSFVVDRDEEEIISTIENMGGNILERKNIGVHPYLGDVFNNLIFYMVGIDNVFKTFLFDYFTTKVNCIDDIDISNLNIGDICFFKNDLLKLKIIVHEKYLFIEIESDEELEKLRKLGDGFR